MNRVMFVGSNSTCQRPLLRVAHVGLLLIVVLSTAVGQSGADALPFSTAYTNHSLGFRYMPPTGMLDKTSTERQTIQAKSAALNAKRVLRLLLALESGRDDSPAWHSVTIEAYPRNAISEQDDLKAEAQMSAWVAGVSKAEATPKQTIISGQTFAVSLLALQEDRTRKGAVIWTTIHNGELLSFAFVANSPERLNELVQTMKTVEFFEPAGK